ncbi:MAG: hypothetical protein AAF657_07685 [Acidobacteriota bacterium]
MRRPLILLTACLAFTAPVFAEAEALATGELIEGIACETDPTQTYTLYLPSGHNAERRWPGLLIFDPRGRSVQAAELFRDAAETYGWVILSSNDTRSDGPADPNTRAIQAMWPEAHSHYSIDPKRIYAAGFSGGAMLGWWLGRSTGTLAGVIASGGRLERHNLDQEIAFPTFGAAGNTDFNYSEMQRVHQRLAAWGTPHRLEIFDGRHRWMPPELARAGVEWMELQAMQSGLRGRDEGLIDRLYRQDVEQAAALEASGDELAALRRYDAITATFDGLREVAGPRREAKRLTALASVAAAEKDAKRWDAFERTYRQNLGSMFAVLRADPPASARRLAVELRLPELQKRALEPAYEGVVARRLLETLLTQTSFYLMRDFFAQQDWASAIKVLTLASEIRPERIDVWYNLACAQARSGSRKKALAALERAVDAGFANAQQLLEDPDLEALHRHEKFRQLVARLEDS